MSGRLREMIEESRPECCRGCGSRGPLGYRRPDLPGDNDVNLHVRSGEVSLQNGRTRTRSADHRGVDPLAYLQGAFGSWREPCAEGERIASGWLGT